VSFTRKPSRFEEPQSRVPLPRRPPGALVRLVLFAVLAIVAAVWALWDHYSRVMPPWRVPVSHPSAAPTYDADAGEVPAPEVIQDDGR
jgi:hypothetical protein